MKAKHSRLVPNSGGELSDKYYNFAVDHEGKADKIFTELLESCSPAKVAAIKNDCKPPEGFACPKTTSKTNKSDKQLLFLVDLFLMGVEKKQKVSPIQAYEFMRNAVDETGARVFSRKELLTPTQIKSWFGSRARKCPKRVEQLKKLKKMWGSKQLAVDNREKLSGKKRKRKSSKKKTRKKQKADKPASARRNLTSFFQ